MIDFDEELDESSEPDMTPMIDMVFLLLIFFMLTSVFAKPSLPLDLPSSESAITASEPSLYLAITRDNQIYLKDKKITLAELYPELARIYADKKSKEISMIIDKSVMFEKIVEVMDAVKKAGVENISVQTENK